MGSQTLAESVSQSTQPTNHKSEPIVLAVFETIAAILAIRFFLLLAIVGAFVLGVMTVQSQDNHSLWTLGIYCAFTILPLVFLDRKERLK